MPCPRDDSYDPAEWSNGKSGGLRLQSIYTQLHKNVEMNPQALAQEIIGTYRKHGWQLRRALLRPETRNLIGEANLLAGIEIEEAPLDAFWFSRPSHDGREAWELRLLSENAYALFETFPADASAEAQEASRRDMETRLSEHLKR